MPDHDHSYKLLFSQAETVRDLVESFMHEEWVERRDFTMVPDARKWRRKCAHQSSPEGLTKYCPRLGYLLTDENEFAEDELNPLQNLVADLFALENARTAQDVQRILETVRLLYEEHDSNELQRALIVWFKRVMLPIRLPGIEIPEVNTLREMNTMLAERVVEWTQEWKAGKASGGIAKGTGQPSEAPTFTDSATCQGG